MGKNRVHGHPMTPPRVRTRRAQSRDAKAIALAHIDSIRSIGSRFYSPEVVEAWAAGLTTDVYVKAMEGGEAFFLAAGRVDRQAAVLGFSTHRVDDDRDGISVYVRGQAARRGIGTLLLRLAEEHARTRGATRLEVDASLAAVEFYRANAFEVIGRGEHVLPSGRSMACVFMRKLLA
jgi:putative acetyltransferase